MRVFNKKDQKLKETLNIRFLKNAPNVIGNGPNWLFDVDSLTKSMNYMPVVVENQTNGITGTKDNIEKKTNSTNSFNTVGTLVSAARPSFTNDDPSSPVNAAKPYNAFEDHLFERFSLFKNSFALPHIPNVFLINDTGNVCPIPTTRIDKDHPKDQIIKDLNSAIQTKRMTKISDEHAMKVIQALADPSLGRGNARGASADGPNFKVNGHRVKHYFGGDLPPKEVQDPGHLAARLGCAETKVATWDDLAFKRIILRHVKRGRETKIPQSSGPPIKGGDEVVHKELGDRMKRAATTASSLEAEQDSSNINKTQSIATLNGSSPNGIGSGSGPRCQDTILGGVDAQTRFKTTSK
ncbi:hypothetical protein Tco_1387182 [Tanacetum coccineum]